MQSLLRRTFEPAVLLAEHPPIFRHPHKRMIFKRSCPDGATHHGPIEVTRWRAEPLPERCELAPTEIVVERGHYRYDGAPATWHVNFADPNLFVAYGSALLAQDELQAAEHPLLGSIREALGVREAVTEDQQGPTPVLVAGVERRCEIDTAPNPQRPYGLYGNRFAAADADTVERAVRVIDPPTKTNLIAMAAPAGNGPYFRQQLEQIAITAYTGFAAARMESQRLWPGVPVEVRTGFWGCGAFGGNRVVMTLLQLLAARLAGLDRLRFYAFDEQGIASFERGRADLARVLGPAQLADVIERVADLDYQWGVSDGN